MTEGLLRDLDCADPFVEDIPVSGGTSEMTDEELIQFHFVILCKVLEVRRKPQLTRNAAKAVLFATEVEFPGQVVGHGIRRPIPEKPASLAHWKVPKNITEMRALLGI